ncbi:MAG: MFS transporter [Pseudomonadota bacterium]
MLLGSAGAILYSTYSSWPQVYFMASIIIFILSIIIQILLRKISSSTVKPLLKNASSQDSLIDIIRSFGKPVLVTQIVLFLFGYRLADYLIAPMLNPLLLTLGLGPKLIASAGKTLGMVGALIGGSIGGIIMNYWPLRRCLLSFGLIHTSSWLCYLWLYFNLSNQNLVITVTLVAISGGMAMAAFIGFITKLSQGQHSGTKYSFLASIMGLSRTITPLASGIIVENIGWFNFLIIVSCCGLPALVMLKESKVLNKLCAK